jgi:hypothetical protein
MREKGEPTGDRLRIRGIDHDRNGAGGVIAMVDFLPGEDYLRRYFDIFKFFKGTLDHLLTRIQFLRFSPTDRLSGDVRRSWFRKNRPLIEKRRLLSLPVLLSMKDRLLFCIETPPSIGVHWIANAGSASLFKIQA